MRCNCFEHQDELSRDSAASGNKLGQDAIVLEQEVQKTIRRVFSVIGIPRKNFQPRFAIQQTAKQQYCVKLLQIDHPVRINRVQVDRIKDVVADLKTYVLAAIVHSSENRFVSYCRDLYAEPSIAEERAAEILGEKGLNHSSGAPGAF